MTVASVVNGRAPVPEVGTGVAIESSLAEFVVVPARMVMFPALSKVRSPDWYEAPAGGVSVPAWLAVSVAGLKANR